MAEGDEMNAKQLRAITQQLITGLAQLEKADTQTDMVVQQLIDAKQLLDRASRGLESREREKVEN